MIMSNSISLMVTECTMNLAKLLDYYEVCFFFSCMVNCVPIATQLQENSLSILQLE